MNDRQRCLAAAALLAAITLLVYWPAMRGGFIWDDHEMILDNAVVHSPHGLAEMWLGKKLPEYHPLTYSVFWLEWRWWGLNPAGYHVINILLHAADVMLLWLVLRKLRVAGAWLAALLFGVHPVMAGTVAWVAELKNTLSMLFYLASILSYLQAVEPGGKTKRGWYALALVAFALALVSKISVVVLPAVLLLIGWWREGRISRAEAARTAPFFLLGAAAGLLGTRFQSHFTGLSDPLLTRLLGGSWAVWFYLWKLLWPFHLTIVYPRWEIHATDFAAWIPGVCFIAMLGVFWRVRVPWGRACLFGVGYFLIALGPVLGVFKMVFFDFSQVADHLQYLAAPGIIALVVAAGAHWLRTRARLFVAVVAVLALGILTWQHEEVYADMGSLWRQNLVENPDSVEALLYAGGEADRQHHYAEAEKYFQRVLEMNPNSVEGTYNMAVLLDDEGRVDEAIVTIEKTLRLRPEQADAHILLAWFLDEKNREDEAAGHLREAIRLSPNDFRSYQNLGNVLVKQGRVDEAIQQLNEAARLAPDNAGVYVALGAAQQRRGDLAAAQRSFQEALRLDPGNLAAKNGLDAVKK